MRPVFLAATGSKLAPRELLSDATARGLIPEGVTDEMLSKSGITALRAASDPTKAAPDMAVAALGRALEAADYTPDCLTRLFHASSFDGSQMQVWSPPAYVQSAFGDSRAPALGASATCGGGLAAFEVAAIITQARGETVAVATSDMWAAPLVNRWHTMPAFGLGDGAGAAILTTDELGAMARLLACETLTDSSLEAGARTPLPFIPGDTRPINFRERKDAYIAAMPGDDLDAKEKAFNAKRDAGLCAAVAATLRHAGENARSFDLVIPSFLGRAMIDREFIQPLSRLGFVPAQFEPACELGLSIGHVGAGDPFIALDLLRSTEQLTKGSNVLVLGVGGGYTWTAAALNIIH